MLALPKGGAAHLQTPGLGLELLSKLAANPSQLCSSALSGSIPSEQVAEVLWSQHLFRGRLLAPLLNTVAGKRGNRAKNGTLVQKVLYVKLYRFKFFKNKSLLHPHKHHFFVLFLPWTVTPHGPRNFPSGRHTGRHKAMKKISPALSRVLLPFLLLSLFHLIYFNHYHHTVTQTLVLWPTSSCEMCALLLHESLFRCQKSCSLCS